MQAVGAGEEIDEYLFKVIVVGDCGCGKTSIIKRYVHNLFNQNYKATIGVDFALKVVPKDEHTVVRIQMWDIAGQERFGNMTRVYYREAAAAIVVFRQDKPESFEAVVKWKHDIDTKLEGIPVVLFANMSDLVTNHPDAQTMAAFCKQHGFIGWFETSAKTNAGIADGVNMLVNQLVPDKKKPQQQDPGPDADGTIKLEQSASTKQQQQKSECC